MLIDRRQKTWIVWTVVLSVTAIGLYLWLSYRAPDGLTGGSTVGLWYGIVGFLLMVYAGLLSAHRKILRWPLVPSRAWMLKGHIWLGLLSFVLILCHSGFRWGGTFESVLWIVFGLVLLTGILGLALQQALPRLLTLRLPDETPYEQMPFAILRIREEADQLIEKMCGVGSDDGTATVRAARMDLLSYYEQEVRPYLATAVPSPLLDPLLRENTVFGRFHSAPDLVAERSRVEQLEELCGRRRRIAEQERLHHWLHAWLLIHIPLSVALLILTLAHAVVALYY